MYPWQQVQMYWGLWSAHWMISFRARMSNMTTKSQLSTRGRFVENCSNCLTSKTSLDWTWRPMLLKSLTSYWHRCTVGPRMQGSISQWTTIMITAWEMSRPTKWLYAYRKSLAKTQQTGALCTMATTCPKWFSEFAEFVRIRLTMQTSRIRISLQRQCLFQSLSASLIL